MGCCASTSAARATAASGRTAAEQAPGATETNTETTVLLEVSPQERALVELKRIFEAVHALNGHASKAELVTALEKEQELAALLKEAGLNETMDFVNKVGGVHEDFLSWESFQQCAEKAVVEEAKHEVKELEQEVVADLEAGEKALKWLKEAFEKVAADAEGAVNKQDLAAILQQDVQEAGDSIGKLIVDAGFNPMWSAFDHLDTNKDGAVTWTEFEAHVRSAVMKVEKEVEVVVEDTVATQRCWACC